MSTRIELLKETIRPVRERLIAHPIYRSIQSPDALRMFMEFHVYAVWDFMSLLKALQQKLTCVDVPWVPRGSAGTRYLINEIVVGEESDVDELGRRTSHFELYLRAMEEAGADTGPVRKLVQALVSGRPVGEVFDERVPEGVIRDFLDFTFGVINRGGAHLAAAVFTFGREDLIPDLFLRIVGHIPGSFGIFTYYLERHIEVDGGHHSQLAMAMLEELCGEDDAKWADAAVYAGKALEVRIRLWDGCLEAIMKKEGVGPEIEVGLY